MSTPTHPLADAIREVTIAVQNSIDDGHRSREIDADDLVEILLAIADRLDPPVGDTKNAVAFPCPDCGESCADRLIWRDEVLVRCDTCGTLYSPEN